jgi:L-ascorbate metabolism protein UlaG (beta-lactamase superfamily)
MDVTITKLVHACLLVEVDDRRILLDPGIFTTRDERFELSMVEGVDRILITHEHADHVDAELVRAVVERSNEADVESTPSLCRILADEGIATVGEGTPRFAAPHERIPIGPGPQNTGFHVEGVLSHPGDSHSFAETMPILAMPFAAPWGSLVAGVDRTRLVKPRYVIPIHDWFLSEGGKDFMYGLATAGLSEDDIELIHINDFESTTLSV